MVEYNFDKTEGISFIIPFYYGNKVIQKAIDSITEMAIENSSLGVEVVIVNDSPNVDITATIKNEANNIVLRKLCNEKNMGVHYSRVMGVQASQYNWIVFLDQDDIIVSKNYRTQISCVGKDVGVVVGNGMYILNGKKSTIFKKRTMERAISEGVLLNIGNTITSPGQCIINKKIIPKIWTDSIMTKNGADDWMLWLLLANLGIKFVVNKNIVYVHNDVGENLSFDHEKMHQSCLEMIELLEKSSFPRRKLNKLINSENLMYLKHSGKLDFKAAAINSTEIFRTIFYKLMII